MPRGNARIEPPRSAEDFIGDLPTREYENMSPADAPTERVNMDTRDIKRVAIRPVTVLRLAIGATLFACGWTTAAVQYITGDAHYTQAESQATSPAVDPVTPTVTETKTVTQLPKSCTIALRDMQKYLDAAAAVSAAGDQQIDLLSEAYVAIINKDWKGLNTVSEKQRDLQTDTLPASSKVVPKLVEVRGEIKTCLADAG